MNKYIIFIFIYINYKKYKEIMIILQNYFIPIKMKFKIIFKIQQLKNIIKIYKEM